MSIPIDRLDAALERLATHPFHRGRLPPRVFFAGGEAFTGNPALHGRIRRRSGA